MATVRVKIAVAVGPDGRWNASGWSEKDNVNECSPDAMNIAVEGTEDGEARYWVIATLHVPEAQTVEGEAETAT